MNVRLSYYNHLFLEMMFVSLVLFEDNRSQRCDLFAEHYLLSHVVVKLMSYVP